MHDHAQLNAATPSCSVATYIRCMGNIMLYCQLCGARELDA